MIYKKFIYVNNPALPVWELNVVFKNRPLIRQIDRSSVGVGRGQGPNLRLGHSIGPPAMFRCLTCKGSTGVPLLKNLAKHIESSHCPDELLCLLCKPDVNGESSVVILTHFAENGGFGLKIRTAVRCKN
jgi:hypothetical protein